MNIGATLRVGQASAVRLTSRYLTTERTPHMDGPVMRRRRGKKVFLSRFVPSVPVVIDLDGANLDDRPLRFP